MVVFENEYRKLGMSLGQALERAYWGNCPEPQFVYTNNPQLFENDDITAIFWEQHGSTGQEL